MAGKKYWIAGYPDQSTTKEAVTIASNFFSDANKEGAEKLIDFGQAIKDITVNGTKISELLSLDPINDIADTESNIGSLSTNTTALSFIYQVLKNNKLISS